MEGERRVPDPAVRPGAVKEFEDAQPGKVLPRFGAKAVEEIEIDMVRGEPGKLFVQVPVHVLPAGDKPARELGGEEDLVAVPVPQRPPDDQLALPVVVRVGRIDIIDPAVNGGADQSGCLLARRPFLQPADPLRAVTACTRNRGSRYRACTVGTSCTASFHRSPAKKDLAGINRDQGQKCQQARGQECQYAIEKSRKSCSVKKNGKKQE